MKCGILEVERCRCSVRVGLVLVSLRGKGIRFGNWFRLGIGLERGCFVLREWSGGEFWAFSFVCGGRGVVLGMALVLALDRQWMGVDDIPREG